jgi:hypothetical protein
LGLELSGYRGGLLRLTWVGVALMAWSYIRVEHILLQRHVYWEWIIGHFHGVVLFGHWASIGWSIVLTFVRFSYPIKRYQSNSSILYGSRSCKKDNNICPQSEVYKSNKHDGPAATVAGAKNKPPFPTPNLGVMLPF